MMENDPQLTKNDSTGFNFVFICVLYVFPLKPDSYEPVENVPVYQSVVYSSCAVPRENATSLNIEKVSHLHVV